MVDLKRFLARSLENGVNYLLPPVCGSCGEPTQENTGVCGDCWKQLTFISGSCCFACGYPLELSVDENALCFECDRSKKSFDRCRAALVYNEGSRDMIIGYKHADRTHLTKLFSGWLSFAGEELLKEANIVAPVPLHPRRLLSRRYNQSALLAKSLARHHGKKYIPDLLLRTKNTSSQGEFSLAGRWRNVRGAFTLNEKYNRAILNQDIVIIDDVYTTGATIDACCRELKKRGVSNADALVLARVTKE